VERFLSPPAVALLVDAPLLRAVALLLRAWECGAIFLAEERVVDVVRSPAGAARAPAASPPQMTQPRLGVVSALLDFIRALRVASNGR
jgi:hypothetical protein